MSLDLNNSSFKRWCDVLLLSGVSFFIVYIITKIEALESIWLLWIQFNNALAGWAQFLFSILILTCLSYFLHNLGAWHCKQDLRILLKYPPAIWAVPVPLIALICINTTSFNLIIYITLYLLIGYYFFLDRHRALDNKSGPTESPKNNNIVKSTNINTWTDVQLLSYIQTENPIENEDHLLFGRDVYVNRILDKLRSNTSHHIALRGEFGSGKSSIINVVKSRLSGDGWSCITIDAWGRTSETIDQHVLSKIVHALAEKIDVLALRPLPQRYHDILKAKGGNFSFISSLLNGTNQDAKLQLEKLNKVLECIDTRVLICIEDVDRNTKSAEVCVELAALIDKTKGLSHIRFVLAVGYGSTADVVQRVCDYTEDLTREDMACLLSRFLTLWLKRAKENNTYLLSPYHEVANQSRPLDSILYSNQLYSNLLSNVDDLINGIIKTPRAVKLLCRNVDEGWVKNSLMGEIDLIHYVLFTALKQEFPKVIKTIILQKHILLNKHAILSSDSTEKELHKTELQKMLNQPDLEHNLVINNLICKLFVGWSRLTSSEFVTPPKLQELSYFDNGTDYFERYLRGVVAVHEVKDQDVIHYLKAFIDTSLNTSDQIIFIQKIMEDKLWTAQFNVWSNKVWLEGQTAPYNETVHLFINNIFSYFQRKFKKGYIYTPPNSNQYHDISGLYLIHKWINNNSYVASIKADAFSYCALKLALKVDVELALTLTKVMNDQNCLNLLSKKTLSLLENSIKNSLVFDNALKHKKTNILHSFFIVLQNSNSNLELTDQKDLLLILVDVIRHDHTRHILSGLLPRFFVKIEDGSFTIDNDMLNEFKADEKQLLHDIFISINKNDFLTHFSEIEVGRAQCWLDYVKNDW